MAGFSITQKNQNETLVRGLNSPDFDEAQGVAIEIHAFFEILHVDVVVVKPEFHFSFSNPTYKLTLNLNPSVSVSLSGSAFYNIPIPIPTPIASISAP
jgi:hypothetical protein